MKKIFLSQFDNYNESSKSWYANFSKNPINPKKRGPVHYSTDKEVIDKFTVNHDGKVKTYDLYANKPVRCTETPEYYVLLTEGCPFTEFKKHYFILLTNKEEWYNMKNDYDNSTESEKTTVKVWFKGESEKTLKYTVTNGVYYRDITIFGELRDRDPLEVFNFYCEVAHIDLSSEMIYDDNNWSLVKDIEHNNI